MKGWVRAAVVVLIVLGATLSLIGAFGVLAGIEVPVIWPSEENQEAPGEVADFDGDGMPDSWEVQHGLNPDDPADAAGDLDGDGYTNLQEYQAGTNLGNPASYPGSEMDYFEGEAPVDGGIPPHEPLFEVLSAPKNWFMRCSVGEVYEGGIWRLSDNAEATDYGGENLPQAVGGVTGLQTGEVLVNPVVSMGGFIPTFSHTIRIENFEGLKYYPAQQAFFAGRAFEHPYGVDYRVYSYGEGLLRSAELAPAAGYLQLPSSVTERTRQLALEITENVENPYDKAKAIEEYLRESYTYDLSYERAPSGWDPVDWFLFEERRGHCMNFNSAFVILSRSVGISSRTVFGFALDTGAEYQVVYADGSHVNAEVKFENIGWVLFNATAPHPSSITDSDGDGYTDLQEYQAGTDQNDPASYPEVTKIQTSTEVTETSEVVVKGETFQARGEVMDDNGVGVGGLTVLIYLKGSKGEAGLSCGSGVTADNGEFVVACEVAENVGVGDYHVVAHALEGGRYMESWSDPVIKIVAETDILLSTSEFALAGEEFTVRGQLVEKVTRAGLGSRGVDLSVGGEGGEVITLADGSFSAEYSLAQPDNYTVGASFEGSGYYLGSSSQRTIEIVSLDIIPGTGGQVVRGGVLEISGWTPAKGETLEVLLDNELIATTKSGGDGSFEAEHPVPQSTSLGVASLTYRLPEHSFSKPQDVSIFAETSVSYQPVAEVEPGQEFVITAEVRDDLGNPLSGVSLTLSYGSEEEGATTDGNGGASFTVELPKDYGENTLSFRISFPGESFYLSSESEGQTSVRLPPSAPEGFPWAVLAAVAVALVAGIVAYRKRGAILRRWGKPERKEGRVPTKGVAQKRGFRLSVDFPTIEDPLPDVWGLREPLTIAVALRKKGKPVTKADLRVKIDGKSKRVHTSSSGEGRLRYRFSRKGAHGIEVGYREGKIDIRAERDVRIVDYREEMVRLFNSAFNSAMDKDIGLSDETTPREFQRTVGEALRADEEALEVLTSKFEIANYSLHGVGREDYRRTYLSYNSILRSVGEEK